MSRARLPLTLLSGYLGAGKTTLVNRLLAGDHGRRLAVLVNDFGAVNVDAALIESWDETTISLANGCICCSVSDDLGGALDALAAMPEPPEQVLLEASGVADPARVARQAGHWPGYELDAVVTVADAETTPARARDRYVGALIRAQLQGADLVLLSKTDLATPAALAAAHETLAALAPRVPVLYAAAATPALLDPLPRRRAAPGPAAAAPEAAAAVWVPPAALDEARLAAALDRLPESVHRVKGAFRDAAGTPRLVQAVGRRRSFGPAPAGLAPGLVFIAAGPREGLEAALALLSSEFGESGP